MVYGFGTDRDSANQFMTRVFDANGIEKRTYRNLRELITSVWETNKKGGQEAIWTSYAYDPLKQIVEVKDDRGHLTQVTYDNLGRRTAIDNPDLGRTETVYDPASNVTRKITARLKAQGEGIAIAYSYDFNRLTTIAYPNQPENTVRYTYGAPGAPDNRAGRITEVSDASGREERYYGKLGELTQETRTVNSRTQGASATSPEVYTTSYRYDTFGRLLTLSYPDGELLTYAYDAGGNVNYAAGKKGQHTYVYLQALTYDRFEQRVRLEAGNGTVTRYTYDPANRRLLNLQAGQGSGGGANRFQNLRYHYDNVGNVLKLQNDVPVVAPGQFGGPTTQAYAYDDLYRLTEAQGTYEFSPGKRRVYSVAQSYDTIHNILTKAQTDAVIEPSGVAVPQKKTSYSFLYAYEGRGPHAPSKIGERTYSYDLNGNQTGWEHEANGTRRTIVWDDDNRIASVSDNGKTSTYVYDDQGNRALKITPDGETAYINQYFTIRNRELGSKHVFIGTTRLTTKLMKQDKTQSNPKGNILFEKDQYFYHPDHLGSTGYVTDRTGKMYEHVEYFPFGETWVQEATNANNVPYLFTGKELDEETGLYYFGARYFDPRTSVWQSADRILGRYLNGEPNNGVFEPVHLALYTYVKNNPLIYTDPDGDAELYSKSGQYIGSFAPQLDKVFVWPDGNTSTKLIDTNMTISQFHDVAATTYGESSPRAPQAEITGIAHVIKNKGAEVGKTMAGSAATPKWFYGRTNEAADKYRTDYKHSAGYKGKADRVRAGVIDAATGGADPTGGATFFEGTGLLDSPKSKFKQLFIDTKKVEKTTELGGTTFFKKADPKPAQQPKAAE